MPLGSFTLMPIVVSKPLGLLGILGFVLFCFILGVFVFFDIEINHPFELCGVTLHKGFNYLY